MSEAPAYDPPADAVEFDLRLSVEAWHLPISLEFMRFCYALIIVQALLPGGMILTGDAAHALLKGPAVAERAQPVRSLQLTGETGMDEAFRRLSAALASRGQGIAATFTLAKERLDIYRTVPGRLMMGLEAAIPMGTTPGWHRRCPGYMTSNPNHLPTP
ncbi:MAG: hypothetical protein M0000_07670 [Actinomycetota bacterium]|nr:hypothetical protein [Actinomycetota bacterium]MDA8208828.1 hypothetical protein [Actinomycetota bacterium]